MEASKARTETELEKLQISSGQERSDLIQKLQTLQLDKERLEQELKLQLERIACSQALEQQRHELEMQKHQATTHGNLLHLQEMIKLA